MELIKINPNNKRYYSEDFIKGFECGIKRQFEADKKDRPSGEWLWRLADNGWADHICSVCGYTKNTDIHVSLNWSYCPHCGARMFAKDINVPNKEGADDE